MNQRDTPTQCFRSEVAPISLNRQGGSVNRRYQMSH
jgi:hypothetical protein